VPIIIQFNLFNEEMVHLKGKHDVLQVALLDIEQKGSPNLKDVKLQLQELFDSLSNVVHYQNDKISELPARKLTGIHREKSNKFLVGILLLLPAISGAFLQDPVAVIFDLSLNRK